MLDVIVEFPSDSELSIDEIIEKYIIHMGVDFTSASITALCQRLNFPVRIINQVGTRSNENSIAEEMGPPQATFVRRNEHYYVIYP